MARKLASVVQIDAVTPIQDTERLSVATMKGKGWKVVVGREDFKPGNWAVYFEIDSYLPNEERYAFLRERCLRRFMTKDGQTCLKEGLRIKTIKLRGVISQGLLMPMSQFPELAERITPADNMWLPSKREGEEQMMVLSELRDADVTDLLKIEHFDEVKAALAPAMGNPISAESAGSFPSWCPRTDEERIQNLVEYFTTMKDRTFEITVKFDGSSCTMFYAPNESPETLFGVCSRNLRLKPEKADGTKPLPWQMAFKYGVEEKLRKYWRSTELNWPCRASSSAPESRATATCSPSMSGVCSRSGTLRTRGTFFLTPRKRCATTSA